MAKANKTQPTTASVHRFIQQIDDPEIRRDCRTLKKMMEEVTAEKAVMWGDSLIGFGNYHYRYASGREGDFFLSGFSPRKHNLSVYIMIGFEPFEKQLEKLGKHKLGRGCLYIKSLAAIDIDVLRAMVEESVNLMRQRYPD